MHIESGTLKGRKLLGQKAGLRPTTSKVKTALFNIIKPQLVGKNFVDCFAGTGAVGFEAISLGANKVGFVELNKKAVEYLYKNAAHLGVENSVQIRNWDVLHFLNHTQEDWDILFFSPPYDTIHWYQLLRVLEQSPILKSDGMAIIQHPRQIHFDTQILDCYDERNYGFNTLSFFRRKHQK